MVWHHLYLWYMPFFMKTFLFLLTSFIFFTAKAQNPWQIISPHPTGINLNSVSMISETEFWITARYGRIFHTADAGNSWDIFDAPSAFRYYTGIKMIMLRPGIPERQKKWSNDQWKEIYYAYPTPLTGLLTKVFNVIEANSSENLLKKDKPIRVSGTQGGSGYLITNGYLS